MEQEEIAAATLAKNKEWERHASWLERRLEEVAYVSFVCTKGCFLRSKP